MFVHDETSFYKVRKQIIFKKTLSDGRQNPSGKKKPTQISVRNKSTKLKVKRIYYPHRQEKLIYELPKM